MAISTAPIQIRPPSLEANGDELNGDHLPDLSATPCANCPHTIEFTKQRRDAAYYRRMLEKALEREVKLKKEIGRVESQSEPSGTPVVWEKNRKKEINHNPRNPNQTKTRSLADNNQGAKVMAAGITLIYLTKKKSEIFRKMKKNCPCCGLPFDAFPGTEDSEQIEIEVKAHRRIIKRKRYKPACKCGAVPGIVDGVSGAETHSQRALWNLGLGNDSAGQVSVPAPHKSSSGRLEGQLN